MNFNDLPLFSMLKDRLGYLNQRQSVIAENVANSDTPGYMPRDLKPFTVKSSSPTSAALPLAPVSPAVTNPAHLQGSNANAPTSSAAQAWKPQDAPDSETRLDGNQVVLEEQMMKMNDARMNYNAAINFYEQSMALIQTAIRIPGK
jgi:flagellar basal-body rod protein FlgB